MTRRGGISRVAHFRAALHGKEVHTVRQGWRDWCDDAPDKRGQQRPDVEVLSSVTNRVQWILAGWVNGDRRLGLALDAPPLRQTFTGLGVRVVYRGGVRPVAGAIVPTTPQGAWQPHWLVVVATAVAQSGWGLVLTDRGLYAPWLYPASRAHDWHPFLPINAQGQ